MYLDQSKKSRQLKRNIQPEEINQKSLAKEGRLKNTDT